jgi:hypothetical protein
LVKVSFHENKQLVKEFNQMVFQEIRIQATNPKMGFVPTNAILLFSCLALAISVKIESLNKRPTNNKRVVQTG